MRTIHHVFSVSARPDRVFGALTSGEGLSGWWTTKVDVERHVGGHVRFTFGGAFNPDMEITMLREPESLEWRCVSGHENWTGNTFRFELEPEGGSTRVRFWQHYARELADDDYGIYNYNWGYYLESLRLYCETGTGRPFDAEAGPASHEWTDPATPEGERIMQARHRPRRSSPEQMATASRIRVRSALREPPRACSEVADAPAVQEASLSWLFARTPRSPSPQATSGFVPSSGACLCCSGRLSGRRPTTHEPAQH